MNIQSTFTEFYTENPKGSFHRLPVFIYNQAACTGLAELLVQITKHFHVHCGRQNNGPQRCPFSIPPEPVKGFPYMAKDFADAIKILKWRDYSRISSRLNLII